MAVVVDANVMVRLAQRDALAPAIEQRIQIWIESGEELHVPSLYLYEAANALVRSVARGNMAVEALPVLWNRIMALPVTIHVVDDGLDVMEIGIRLGRQNSYDAVYLSLAQRLDATVWTIDGPLYRNASPKGFRIQLIEAL